MLANVKKNLCVLKSNIILPDNNLKDLMGVARWDRLIPCYVAKVVNTEATVVELHGVLFEICA